MERLFKTHEIRKQRELSGLWDFYKEGAQEDTRKVIVPSCFETYPGLENYTGVGCYEYKTFLQGNTAFASRVSAIRLRYIWTAILL